MSDAPPSLSGKTILLLEDDKEIRDMFAGALRHAGARVHAANSADAALKSVQGDHLDLLVVDLGLQEGSGWEFLEAVRRLPAERGGQTPAIAVSALGSDADRRRSLLAGFRLHVLKPIDGARLCEVVVAVLAWAAPSPS